MKNIHFEDEKLLISKITPNPDYLNEIKKLISEETYNDINQDILKKGIEELKTKLMKNNDEIKTLSAFDLLNSDIEMPTDLVFSIIMKAGLTIFGGQPGEYKSYLAHDLALAIASGGKFLGRQATQGKVIYIDKEMRYPALKQRLKWLSRGRGMTEDQLNNLIFVSSDKLTITEKKTYEVGIDQESKTFFKNLCEQHKPSLLIFDSLVRFTAGNENDSADMKLLFSFCSELMSEYEVSVLLLHHLRKGGKDGSMNDLRGSSDLSGSPDYIWMTSKGYMENTLKMVKCRHRETEKKAISFKLLSEKDETGEIILQTIDCIGFVENKRTTKQDVCALILDALKRNGKLSMKQLIYYGTKESASEKTVRNGITALTEENKIIKESGKFGLYRLIDDAQQEQEKETVNDETVRNGNTDNGCSLDRNGKRQMTYSKYNMSLPSVSKKPEINPYTSGEKVIHASDHIVDLSDSLADDKINLLDEELDGDL